MHIVFTALGIMGYPMAAKLEKVKLVDQFFAEVEAPGRKRRDTSRITSRLERE